METQAQDEERLGRNPTTCAGRHSAPGRRAHRTFRLPPSVARHPQQPNAGAMQRCTPEARAEQRLFGACLGPRVERQGMNATRLSEWPDRNSRFHPRFGSGLEICRATRSPGRSAGFALGDVRFPSLAGKLNGTARARSTAYVAASRIRIETARVTPAASATQFSSFSRKSLFIFISSS